jgi:hypothetical protein
MKSGTIQNGISTIGIQKLIAVEKIWEQHTQKLLSAVAASDLARVQYFLELNPRLALSCGTVTDPAGRSFEHITPFQYALWAYDIEMCKSILKVLSDSECSVLAAKQYQELSGNGRAYGHRFDIAPLLKALEKYSDNYEKWDNLELEKYWRQEIGGLQQQLPMNFVKFYLRSEKNENHEKRWKGESDFSLGNHFAWYCGEDSPIKLLGRKIDLMHYPYEFPDHEKHPRTLKKFFDHCCEETQKLGKQLSKPVKTNGTQKPSQEPHMNGLSKVKNQIHEEKVLLLGETTEEITEEKYSIGYEENLKRYETGVLFKKRKLEEDSPPAQLEPVPKKLSPISTKV